MTLTIAVEITKQDVAALKYADSIVFRLSHGQSTIEAYKDGRNTHDGFEAKHTVYAGTSLVDYNRNGSHTGRDTEHFTGFSHFGSSKFHDTLITVLARVRAGDTLKLAWTRGNDNEVGRDVGFVRDELRLVVANGKGKRETYLVDVYVGYDNSARMVRLTG